MGMELLTLEQRNVLDQMRTARAGLASLGDANVAQVLNLSAEQRVAVQRLLEQRAEILKVRKKRSTTGRGTTASSRRWRPCSAPNKRAGWERMAGLAQGTVPAPSAPEVEKTPPPAAPDATGMPAATTAPAGETPAPETSATPSSPEAPAAAAPPADTGSAGAAPPAAPPAATAGSETGQQEPVKGDDVQLRFNFRHQPWTDVLEWFATQADLSLQMESVPPGTLNYRDNRAYTPAEALDLLNGVLLTKATRSCAAIACSW